MRLLKDIWTLFGLFTLRLWLGFCAIAAAAALSVALVAQYGFSLFPCHLCVLQRYPYVAVILIAIAAWRFGSPRWQRLAVLACGLLFAVDAGIAIYHTGVEFGWFPGPGGCTSTATGAETLEEMRRALLAAPLVACDQPMVRIFGLSIAAWNAVFASLAAVVVLGNVFRKPKSL